MLYWIMFLVSYSLIATFTYTSTINQVKAVAEAIKKHHGHDMKKQTYLFTALCSAIWPALVVRTLAMTLAWYLSQKKG